jgi:hypothetical protein
VPKAVEGFLSHQWNLLDLVRCKPEFLDLAESTPALAWCLANCDQFRKIVLAAPAVAAAWRVDRKQAKILEWLGFPGTKSVIRLLRKIPRDSVGPIDKREKEKRGQRRKGEKGSVRRT